MAFKFGPKKAESAADRASSTNPAAAQNGKAKKKQQTMMALLAGGALVLGGMYVFKDGKSDSKKQVTSDGTEVRVRVDDMSSRNQNEGEWIARSENQMSELTQRMSNMEKTSDTTALVSRIENLEKQNTALKADGQRLFATMANENERLRRQVQSAPAQAPNREVIAAEQAAGGGGVGAGRWRGQEPFRVGAGGQASAASLQGGGSPGMAEVKTLSFSPAADAKGGAQSLGFRGSLPAAASTVMEASEDYLPPNSYAAARVVVGVDAPAGVASQTDPLPVLLRITGPARSVVQNGRVLTTRLEGCVVSGAARGDLSSEKVYVKLVKMTCDQPNGRVAESEVKGYLSFAGKAGIRGRVVSREGDLVTKAMLAGVIGGFGRGLTANANALFAGGNTIIDGQRQQMSGKDIAVAGVGQGMGQAADTVSKYLIERAEQYQPVIEMSTGIDVDIVFLEGVYVRGS